MNATVAVVGNPTSNKGKGAEVGKQVVELLQEAGRKHGFNVIDVTGESFDDSLANARNRRNEYDYLVAVGGDGMIALGANAVGCSGKPLGIVATGSGNDFARGLELPVNRVETAVDGIVGAIVRARILTLIWVWPRRCRAGMPSIPVPAMIWSAIRTCHCVRRSTASTRACCRVVWMRVSTTVPTIPACPTVRCAISWQRLWN